VARRYLRGAGKLRSRIRVFRACSSETALRGLLEYFREKPTFGPGVVDAILAKGDPAALKLIQTPL
jgi:hypothetical protein